MKVHLRVALAIFAASVTLLWLGAGSARADAPQCDTRGAITFAPNPVLDIPNASVDVGHDDDCVGAKLDERAYQDSQSPTGASGTDAVVRAASLPHFLLVLPATPTATVERDATTDGEATGTRRSLDRPPRA